jgi:hypothetical protein
MEVTCPTTVDPVAETATMARAATNRQRLIMRRLETNEKLGAS